MRAEFTVTNNDMLNSDKMKLFVQAFKQYNNDIIISSITDKRFKIRLTDDVPKSKAQFVELFPMEEYKRNKATCVHVFFTLESNTRINMFKKDDKFMQFLANNKIFLSEHKWESLRIYSVGMFTKMLYNVTYSMDFESKIQQVINNKMKEEHEKNEIEKANTTSTEMEELFDVADDDVSTKTEHAKTKCTTSHKLTLSPRPQFIITVTNSTASREVQRGQPYWNSAVTRITLKQFKIF
jgi:hypothetical protein